MKTRGEILCELSEKRPRRALGRPRRVLVFGAAAALRTLIANVYRADGHIAFEAAATDALPKTGVDLALLDARAEPTAALAIAARLREKDPRARVGLVVAKHDTRLSLRVHKAGAIVLELPLRSRFLRTILDALSLTNRI